MTAAVPDIVPIRIDHPPSVRACLGEVARERRFLLPLDTPPPKSVAGSVGGTSSGAAPVAAVERDPVAANVMTL